jgi:hypothetical protein
VVASGPPTWKHLLAAGTTDHPAVVCLLLELDEGPTANKSGQRGGEHIQTPAVSNSGHLGDQPPSKPGQVLDAAGRSVHDQRPIADDVIKGRPWGCEQFVLHVEAAQL